jgi:hypothetical protein
MGNGGTVRRVGRLCVEFGRYHAGLCLAGGLSGIYLPTIALEAQAISTRAAALSGAQDSQRTKDGWATATAVVVFWPAAFLVGGDKQTAAELANMKGQMVAVEQASIAKKCNIQFQGERPRGHDLATTRRFRPSRITLGRAPSGPMREVPPGGGWPPTEAALRLEGVSG